MKALLLSETPPRETQWMDIASCKLPSIFSTRNSLEIVDSQLS